MTPTVFSIRGAAFGILAAAFGHGMVGAAPASAQDTVALPSTDYVDALRVCRAIADEVERLACYDTKVGAIVAASEAGDVRVVDRGDLVRTRRQLFGFAVPELDILKDDKQDKEASELLQTSITGSRQLSGRAWRFTTEEGAVWEINNAPGRFAPIKTGDKVEFKRASLGYYFIRINGQMGVKGKRIE
jgi:hypothetical protein